MTTARILFPFRSAESRLWLLFGISFLIHFGVVLIVGHFKNPILWENGMIADYLFSGRGFCGDFSIKAEQTSWQAPAYPYFLAGIWSLLGKNSLTYLIISTMQCVALASMVWPMTFLTRRWFPLVPEVIVQVLVITAPLYLWYGTRLHHTAFVMALNPWILWGWLKWGGRSIPSGLIVGVGTGFFALIQPVILGVYGVIGLSLLISAVSSRQWRAMMALICAGVAVIITLTPWTVRNYRVHGKLLIVKDSFGKEFWMGNNSHATGTGYAIGGMEEVTNLYPPKCFSLRGLIKEPELMDEMGKEAKQWIASNPAAFLRLTANKILWFWTVAPKDRVRTTGAAEAILFRGVYVTYWILLLGFGVVGIMVLRPGGEYLLTLLIFILFYSLVYGLTHVGQARFRGEIECVFFPAAAAGIFWVTRKVFCRGSKPLEK